MKKDVCQVRSEIKFFLFQQILMRENERQNVLIGHLINNDRKLLKREDHGLFSPPTESKYMKHHTAALQVGHG